MITDIIWDFDGTLIDTLPAIVNSFLSVLESEYGLRYDPAGIERLVRIDPKYCAETVGKEYGLDPAVLRSRARAFHDRLSFVRDKPFDGIHEVLKIIASSGGNFLVTHRGRASTESILTRFAMTDYFERIITEEDGFLQKPSPESFNFVIDRHSLDRSSTLGIGDREIDVDAAKNAGIRSCYFGNDGSRIERSEFNISSVRELSDILHRS